MTKEGEESQAKDSSAEKEQGEQEMQEQVKQQVMDKEKEAEEGVEVRREDRNAVMAKVGEQSSEVGLNHWCFVKKAGVENLTCL